jgi:hypothetical protein
LTRLANASKPLPPSGLDSDTSSPTPLTATPLVEPRRHQIARRGLSAVVELDAELGFARPDLCNRSVTTAVLVWRPIVRPNAVTD